MADTPKKKLSDTTGKDTQEEMPLPDILSFSEKASVTCEDKVVSHDKIDYVDVHSTYFISEECKPPRPPNKSDASVAPQLPPNLIYSLIDVKKRPEKKQLSKEFYDFFSQISIDDEDDNFVNIRKETTAFTQPTTFTEGEVKCTTKDALKEMVQQLPDIKKETGCITCDPECSQCTEDTHFAADTNLGQGFFGKVDLCHDFQTKKTVVRKIKSHLRASGVIDLTTLDQLNITKFFGLVGKDSSDCQLYLENGGDSLKKIYSEGRRFNHLQIRSLTKQVLSGLMHLHDKNIIHHDVKPGNICILEKNGCLQLKITDFGSSRLPSDRLDFVGYTPAYMAPEICQLYLQRQVLLGLNWGLEESDITGKVDVFASGLLVLYMYMGYDVLVKVINNGKPTYENMDANRRRSLQLLLMIQMAKVPDNVFFVQLLIPDECSQNMRDLLIGMTQYKHSTRVSARHAFEQIEAFEKRCDSTFSAERKTDACKQKLQPQKIPYITDQTFNNIPVVVEDCMESKIGPVKSMLRRKLLHGPYEKAFEKRCDSTFSAERKTDACKQKLQPQKIPYIPDQTFNNIPVVVEDCMESKTGPVKSRAIGPLRRELTPYEKGRHLSKGSKNLVPMSPQQEMHNIMQEIASGNLEKALPNETVQRISGTKKKCWICPKQFPSRTELYSHIISKEHRKQTVICPWCTTEKTFTQVSNLRKHCSNSHFIEQNCKPKTFLGLRNCFYFSVFPEDYARIIKPESWNSSNAIEARRLLLNGLEHQKNGMVRRDNFRAGWRNGLKLRQEQDGEDGDSETDLEDEMSVKINDNKNSRADNDKLILKLVRTEHGWRRK